MPRRHGPRCRAGSSHHHLLRVARSRTWVVRMRSASVRWLSPAAVRSPSPSAYEYGIRTVKHRQRAARPPRLSGHTPLRRSGCQSMVDLVVELDFEHRPIVADIDHRTRAMRSVVCYCHPCQIHRSKFGTAVRSRSRCGPGENAVVPSSTCRSRTSPPMASQGSCHRSRKPDQSTRLLPRRSVEARSDSGAP